MDPKLVLFPSVAMFCLTLGVILRMGWERYSAIHRGAVSIKFYRTFVAIRCLHTWIQLGSNDVSVRFFTFGASLLALAGLWGCVLAALLRGI